MGKRWRALTGWGLLIGIGIAGRLLPHPPNFTPVEALSLYGGSWSPTLWVGLGMALLIMGISDAFLGWHGLWPYTWGGVLVGVILGRYAFRMERFGHAIAAALTQTVIFFIVTNFGVWLQGWYGLTFSGLVACYVAAIPFLHYQLLGAMFYTSLFWGLFYRLIPTLTKKPLYTPGS